MLVAGCRVPSLLLKPIHHLFQFLTKFMKAFCSLLRLNHTNCSLCSCLVNVLHSHIYLIHSDNLLLARCYYLCCRLNSFMATLGKDKDGFTSLCRLFLHRSQLPCCPVQLPEPLRWLLFEHQKECFLPVELTVLTVPPGF